MGKKKRKEPQFEAWCWYCDREFEDDKVLLQHQRAKHYRCPYCPRRLNTAGGLTVHLHQVHKAEPTFIENALPGRESFDIEIYGMVGVPEADLAEWRARKEKGGGQAGGSAGGHGQSKKPKVDKVVLSVAQLKAQLDAHRALMSGKAPPPGSLPPSLIGPGGYPFAIPPPGFGQRPPPPGMFARPPPPFGVPPPGMNAPFGVPPPGFYQGPPPINGAVPYPGTTTAGSALPAVNPHEQAVMQGAKSRIVYTDTALSPDEKLASTSKYRYVDPEDPAPSSLPPAAGVPQQSYAYPAPQYSQPPPGFSAPPPGYNPYATAPPPPTAQANGAAPTQSYPGVDPSAQPPSLNPESNTAEALAASNASASNQQGKREADMDFMQQQATAERKAEEAVPEPVPATEAGTAGQTSGARSGRARAADLF